MDKRVPLSWFPHAMMQLSHVQVGVCLRAVSLWMCGHVLLCRLVRPQGRTYCLPSWLPHQIREHRSLCSVGTHIVVSDNCSVVRVG